jgi:excisionase family DNA binding protein
MNETKPLRTSKEVAERIGISRPCLWDKCRKGEFPHIALSKRSFRFRDEDVERWLKERSK